MKRSKSELLEKITYGLGIAAISAILTTGASYAANIANSDLKAEAATAFSADNQSKMTVELQNPEVKSYKFTVPGSELSLSIRDSFEESSHKSDESSITNEDSGRTEENVSGEEKLDGAEGKQTPGDNIAEDARTEGDETGDAQVGDSDVSGSQENGNPNTDWSRNISDDVWKILATGAGITTALGATLVTGAVLLKKRKRKRDSINLEDAEYFIGEKNLKNLKKLYVASQKLEDFDEQISSYNKSSARESSQAKRDKYQKKITEIEESKEYIKLKEEQNGLKYKLFLAASTPLYNKKSLTFLSKYAKSCKKSVRIPENNNVKLGTEISKRLEKYRSTLSAYEKNKKFLNKLIAAENQLKDTLLNANLTGIHKVKSDELLSTGKNFFTRENLNKVSQFADRIKLSEEDLFKEYMDILDLGAKGEYLSLKNKNKKSESIKTKVSKKLSQLKEKDTYHTIKYHGKINNLNGEIPINPIRYIGGSNLSTDTKEFFDSVIQQYSFKKKADKIHEITVSIKDNNGKTTSLTCSFDNEEAASLMKAHFFEKTKDNLNSIESIQVSEKTSSLNKVPEGGSVEYSANNINEYKEDLEKLSYQLNNFKQEPAISLTPKDKKAATAYARKKARYARKKARKEKDLSPYEMKLIAGMDL